MVRQLRISTELGQMVALAAIFNLGLGLFAAMAPVEAKNSTIKIVAFGDSLTAGYRLAPDQAFPVRLATKLKAAGHDDVTVANAGVSGDTTAAGLARIDWAVPDDTDAVILELGANDALRGLDPAAARANIEAIITRLKAKNIEVLLTGMRAPRNNGPAYVKAFDSIFPELAAKHGILLYPFFLDGIALESTLNLDDGVHPNARGVDVIVERIMPRVEELIAGVKKRHAGAGVGVQK